MEHQRQALPPNTPEHNLAEEPKRVRAISWSKRTMESTATMSIAGLAIDTFVLISELKDTSHDFTA